MIETLEEDYPEAEDGTPYLERINYEKKIVTEGSKSLKRIFHDCDGLHHEFDFNVFWAGCVYWLAQELALQSAHKLASIQNDTFFDQIVNYIQLKTNIQAEQEEDTEKKFTMTPHFVRSLTLQQLDKLKLRDPDFFAADENFIGAYF